MGQVNLNDIKFSPAYRQGYKDGIEAFKKSIDHHPCTKCQEKKRLQAERDLSMQKSNSVTSVRTRSA